MSRADIQQHKKKGNLLGYFGLAKVGRPKKQVSTKIKAMDAEDNDIQHGPKRSYFARVDWSSLSKFPKLKAAASAYAHGWRLQPRNVVVK